MEMDHQTLDIIVNSRRLAGVIRSRRTDRSFLLSAVCCLLLSLYCPRSSYSFLVVNRQSYHHPTTTRRRWLPHLSSTTSSSSSSSSTETATSDADNSNINIGDNDGGVFRHFANYAIQQLNNTGWLQPLQEMPSDLQFKIGAPLPSSLYKQAKTSHHVNIHNSSTITSTITTSTVSFLDYRVHITVTALEAMDVKSSPIQYARIVLMETLPFNSTITSTKSASTSTPPYHHGLHALNIVVFPNNQTTLPIWGVSMATTVPQTSKLPTMITIDAQPMSIQEQKNDNENEKNENDDDYTAYFKDWYYRHVHENPNLPWGGPLRPTVQPYMSDYLLWSKLPFKSKNNNDNNRMTSNNTTMDDESTSTTTTRPIMIQSPNQTSIEEKNSATIPTTKTTRIQNDTTISSPILEQKTSLETIQGDVWDAYQEHLDIYLNMVQTEFNKVDNVVDDTSLSSTIRRKNQQVEYCDYWRYNEPERTTLQTLFGKEWTERLLWQIMFPYTNNKNNNNSTTKTRR